ncbi:MAG: LacI family DNA-binding transcriptional regulator [Candidatus Methylomirabilales bacterium]
MVALSGARRRRKCPGAITLASVAQRAGVSLITASRALRHSKLVAEATRHRVLAAATELGYTLNLLARGLVHNRTATVGVVVLELANPFFAPMLSAIHAVAAKRGFFVVIGESSRDEEEERQYIEQFQQLRIGGMIVSPVTNRLDHLLAVRANGTPVVVMARRWEDGDYVSTDDVEGGRLAAEHLLKRGHRRIALIRRGDPRHTPVQAIVQGFHEVLGSAGIAVPDAWDVRVADGQIKDGMEAADRLLAQSERPSAVFVTSDRKALGVVHRLQQRGIRVPEDVAVVGYDDIPYAECSRVPLTTIAVPKRLVGEISAELPFQRYDGSGPTGQRQILLPPELMIRASSP